MEVPRVPFSTLSRACHSFSPDCKIGEGPTGEVFRGHLDGADVALKRFRLPKGCAFTEPDAKTALMSAFHAELALLSSYRHPRLVRLLSYAQDEDPASCHPFVLAFELLEEGSLADHLRGPEGEPPRLPPLTPLERVDAALGAAAALAYLHGLREDAERGGGGGGGGGAAAALPQAPVLHRDIKAANIGLTRAGGAMYSKLLDCGLARAVQGGAAAAAAAAAAAGQRCPLPDDGGVVGTLGYMAPELARGAYSPASDAYALGCVLLELLSGARLGCDTASELEARANEEGEGAAAVRAAAEACWPPPAADALAALALRCLHHLPRRRLAAMGEALAALRALRGLVAALVAPAAPPLLPCPVCLEDAPEAGGLQCSAGEQGGRHFICHGCLQLHVRSRLQLAALRASSGHIPCHVGGCGAAWRGEDMAEALDKGTWCAMFVALRRLAIDGPAEAAQLAARQAAALAAAAQLELAQRVVELRRVIVERDLLLRCPRCAAEFDDYSGCNALTCGNCGTGFCAVCLADCGADAHPHHAEVHSGDYFDRALFEAATRARYLARVVAAVQAAGGAEVQRALVAELGKADLRDLGISEAEVLQGAGVLLAGGGGGGGGAMAEAAAPAAAAAAAAPLPAHLFTLTVSGCIQGGGTGREFAANLLQEGQEPWNKWIDPLGSEQPCWVQLDLQQPTLVAAYALQSANDCPERDPTQWTLLGTRQGAETGGEARQWEVLHEGGEGREGGGFTERWQWLRAQLQQPAEGLRGLRLELHGMQPMAQLGHIRVEGLVQ